jgi:hypothetical protein
MPWDDAQLSVVEIPTRQHVPTINGHSGLEPVDIVAMSWNRWDGWEFRSNSMGFFCPRLLGESLILNDLELTIQQRQS